MLTSYMIRSYLSPSVSTVQMMTSEDETRAFREARNQSAPLVEVYQLRDDKRGWRILAIFHNAVSVPEANNDD